MVQRIFSFVLLTFSTRLFSMRLAFYYSSCYDLVSYWVTSYLFASVIRWNLFSYISAGYFTNRSPKKSDNYVYNFNINDTHVLLFFVCRCKHIPWLVSWYFLTKKLQEKNSRKTGLTCLFKGNGLIRSELPHLYHFWH